ncbi:MAG: GntR family transcriptional regulator [Pseudomonas sp.]|uniref:GntR family transcriptional regulator n=1 Tax=Pseudomonas sp. TaxID=306 RepID=UPI003D6E66FC
MTVETLEEDIAFGYMHPRERLVEDELRARFGLKRHVVRQVLAELEKMGLVERKKNIGALVKSYSVKDVVDLYAVRDILETSCARSIALPVSPEKLDELDAIQQRHDDAVRDSNLHVAFRMNIAFHKALFALSDNAALTEMIELAAQRAHVIRSLSMVVPQYLEKARRDHREMIDALRQCDQERLVALCRDHLLPSRNAYIEQQQRMAHLSERASMVNLKKATS